MLDITHRKKPLRERFPDRPEEAGGENGCPLLLLIGKGKTDGLRADHGRTREGEKEGRKRTVMR